MGWLGRRGRLAFDLIGGERSRPAPLTAGVEVRGRRWIAPTAGDAGRQFHVSGEQYRQRELESVGTGARVFHLVRDPANPHDPNAVKVMCDGVHIGFISARNAPRYGGVINEVEAAGYELWVRGIVKRQANAHSSSWVARIDCGWPEDIPTP